MGERWQKLWRAPLTAAVASFCLMTGLAAYFIQLEDSAFQARQSRRVAERVNVARAVLERELNLDLTPLYAYQALIVADPGLRPEQFDEVSEILMQKLRAVRVVELAPAGVVRYAYPEAEATKVRGLDLLKLPNSGQAKIVQETLRDGRVRLAGPMPLFQGGIGLVARNPIYIDGGGQRRFWGLASIILDYDRFLENLPALTQDPDVEFAIRGKDGLGAQGALFYGTEEVFSGGVTADVSVPGGSWQVAGRPRGGWRRSPIYSGSLRGLALLGILALTGVAYAVRRRGNAMMRAATFDTLTGVLRRDSLMGLVTAEIRRAERYHRRLSLLMLDLDHFKKVNDRWGHGAGDAVLTAITRRMKERTRPSDIIGRLGGEEFVVLCPETGVEEAAALAERIRSGVEHHPIMLGAERIAMTVSIGVAEFQAGRDSQNSWMSAADQALYRAKGEGRNRVVAVEAEGTPDKPKR